MKNKLTAKRLRFALDIKGLKPIELARLTNIGRSSISQYMNGTYVPSNLSSDKMASVLGVNPLWLMGFDVPMDRKAYATTETKTPLSSENTTELLQNVLNRDDKIGDYKFSEEQLTNILNYARFIKESSD